MIEVLLSRQRTSVTIENSCHESHVAYRHWSRTPKLLVVPTLCAQLACCTRYARGRHVIRAVHMTGMSCVLYARPACHVRCAHGQRVMRVVRMAGVASRLGHDLVSQVVTR